MIWFAMFTACAASGPCDSKFKTDTVAVTSMPARVRSEAAGALLSQDCALPEKVEAALDAFQSAPPEYRPMLDMALAADDIDSWNAACPGGPAALVAVSKTGDRTTLWEACELERLGVFTQAELGSVKLVVAPIIAAHILREQGAPELETRWAVRMLAGLSPK